jgi:hypothetical protein
VSDQLKEAM